MMHESRHMIRRALAVVGVLAILMPALGELWAQGPIGDRPRRPLPGGEGRSPSSTDPGGFPDNPSNRAPIPNRAPQRIPENQPLFTADTNAVTVDIAILDNKGQFIANIPPGNFQILEDGVPQKIVSVGQTQAPATVALLIEFSNRWQQYWSETWYQTITATYGFVETLRPEDWVAVIAYDLRPEILADFTQDRREINNALQRLRIAAYRESNLFDALTDTVQRMSGIEGRKSVVLLSSGEDTFSRLNFSQARRIVPGGGRHGACNRAGPDAEGASRFLRLRWRCYADRLAPGDNQLRTFTRETGGFAFFPRFYGQFPTIFQSLNYLMRNQYTAVYQPSNTRRDGKFREIKVRLVDPQTNRNCASPARTTSASNTTSSRERVTWRPGRVE